MARKKKRKSTRKSRRKPRRNKSRSKKGFSLDNLLKNRLVQIVLIICVVLVFMFGTGMVTFSATDARLDIGEGWGNFFDFGWFQDVPELGIAGVAIFALIIVLAFLLVAVYMGRNRIRGYMGNRAYRSKAKAGELAARASYMERLSTGFSSDDEYY